MGTCKPPDRELGPYSEFLTTRVTKGMAVAIATRAAAEGVDRAVVHRRLLRIGCQIEGLDITGLGRPPMPVSISPEP